MPSPEKPESEAELEARLRKLLGESEDGDTESDAERKARELLQNPIPTSEPAHEKLQEVEAEFSERLRGLDQRLSVAKVNKEKGDEKAKQTLIAGQDAQGLSTGLSIAYAILGIPILFGAIGLVVDKMFATALAGIFTVTGVVLAMFYVFYALSRQK